MSRTTAPRVTRDARTLAGSMYRPRAWMPTARERMEQAMRIVLRCTARMVASAPNSGELSMMNRIHSVTTCARRDEMGIRNSLHSCDTVAIVCIPTLMFDTARDDAARDDATDLMIGAGLLGGSLRSNPNMRAMSGISSHGFGVTLEGIPATVSASDYHARLCEARSSYTPIASGALLHSQTLLAQAAARAYITQWAAECADPSIRLSKLAKAARAWTAIQVDADFASSIDWSDEEVTDYARTNAARDTFGRMAWDQFSAEPEEEEKSDDANGGGGGGGASKSDDEGADDDGEDDGEDNPAADDDGEDSDGADDDGEDEDGEDVGVSMEPVTIAETPAERAHRLANTAERIGGESDTAKARRDRSQRGMLESAAASAAQLSGGGGGAPMRTVQVPTINITA